MVAISKLVINSVQVEKHHGEYMCSNSHGHSSWELPDSIPYWAQWGSWSSCNKTCKTFPDGQPGRSLRTRECIGHVDERKTCSGSKSEPLQVEVVACTGDGGTTDVFCPVPPKYTEWTEWSACSKDCETGTQERSMTCTPGMFHVNPEDNLCNTPNHELYAKETRICNTHDCPDCEWEPWGDWTECSQTCRQETETGTKTKTRRRKVQSKGSKERCPETETQTAVCGNEVCSVDGTWSSWRTIVDCTSMVFFSSFH